MTPQRRTHRSDLNQGEIVMALRAIGCTVRDLSQVGQGCPDILCGIHGINILLEIKGKRGKLTAEQVIFHKAWAGQLEVVRSIDEAVEAVNKAVRRMCR